MMLDFQDAYTLWRRHRIPAQGRGAVLPETFSDLVLADHYVTTVIEFVEKGVYKPAVPDVLGFIAALRERLERAADQESPELRQIALEQRAYAGLLRVVYEQFLALDPSRSKSAPPR